MTDRDINRTWKARLYEVIFEADTVVGKFFDVALIAAILTSVLVVMLDSIRFADDAYSRLFYVLEWLFTVLFTVEYVLRLVCVAKAMRYAASFFGVVDLLSILPTYLSLLLPGSQYLLVIRILRVLRVFRVFKLVQYLSEARILLQALVSSRRKIIVFIFTVMTLVIVFGSLMYLIEGAENGFTSIPRSIYWAIVTLTTVGYGDISPKTGLGQTISSIIMILGYGIIAVPTGIMTVELTRAQKAGAGARQCPACHAKGHDMDAVFCKHCAARLSPVAA